MADENKEENSNDDKEDKINQDTVVYLVITDAEGNARNKLNQARKKLAAKKEDFQTTSKKWFDNFENFDDKIETVFNKINDYFKELKEKLIQEVNEAKISQQTFIDETLKKFDEGAKYYEDIDSKFRENLKIDIKKRQNINTKLINDALRDSKVEINTLNPIRNGFGELNLRVYSKNISDAESLQFIHEKELNSITKQTKLQNVKQEKLNEMKESTDNFLVHSNTTEDLRKVRFNSKNDYVHFSEKMVPWIPKSVIEKDRKSPSLAKSKLLRNIMLNKVEIVKETIHTNSKDTKNSDTENQNKINENVTEEIKNELAVAQEKTIKNDIEPIITKEIKTKPVGRKSYRESVNEELNQQLNSIPKSIVKNAIKQLSTKPN